MDLVTSQLYFLPGARSDPSLNDIPLSHTAMLHQMAMYQQQPLTPVYSRPSSSSSHSGAPAKTFFSGPRSAMTPAASPSSSRTASLMALEAKLDCSNGYLPSTPPLSSCGGSSFTSAGDMMHTPMNPMFSGLDENFDLCEKWSLDWSGCTSPPMTPLYISQTPASLSRSSTDFSNTSCPSLTQSPSPTPYTRAVSLESSASFCDPRNLTVLSGSVSSAPTSAAAPDVCASFGSSGGAHQQHQQRHGPVVDTAAVQAFVAANPLPSSVAPQGLALDSSDDDFSVHLAGLGDGVSSCDDIRRPRAVTGSSVVSLGHSSFIGEEVVLDPTTDDLVLAYLQPPAAKRFRSSNDMSCGASAAAAVAAAASSPKQEGTATTPVAVEDQAQSPSDNASVASDGSSNANTSSSGSSSSAKRRGRKQSVTEDPTKTWVCDICHRRFRRQEHLKRHTRSLHTMEKPFKCNDCGKTFSRSDNLAQHARTHGTGAIVMDILDDGTVSSYDPGMMVGEFRELGAALYHMAANAMTTIPDVSGSSSSSHDGSDGSDGSDSDGSNKKKRKRS